MAPKAKILLVESTTNSYDDLLAAVDYARKQPGVCTVSMSWARPLSAITCASTGTRTSLVATRALTVSTPNVGGQSMST